MRLQIMSDIHVSHWGAREGVNWFSQEFAQQTQTDADVLILAGDAFDLKARTFQWSLARLTELGVRYKHVVYVPGNHEYYGDGIWDVQEDLPYVEATVPGLHILWPGKSVTIDGQRFLGGTMFQPYEEGLPTITDHYTINDFVPEADKHYRELRAYLEKELDENDIVVTHHAPSNKSIDAQWVGDPCNRWFITPEMEPLIAERQPKLWIHGHVHTCWDYQIGKTRVIANPLGYWGENRTFNPKLIVEI